VRFAVSLLNLRPGRVGGAETYVRELVRHLPAAAAETGDEVVAIGQRDALDAAGASGLETVVVERRDEQTIAARVAEAFTPWRDRVLERLFAGVRPDAVLFPQQSIYPKRVAAPAVLTVVDVQHLFFPQHFGAFDRALRATIYPYSLRRARRIVCISEYTRSTLVERAGVPPGKAVAIPFGFAPGDARGVVPHDGLPTPYLYYPAASFPHKNHATLFRSYAALRRRGALSAALVLSGAKTPRWRALERLVAELGIERDVVHLGFRPFAEIQRVYAGATAVVFPTLFEGFGLPVLEAVQLGRKVITSRLPVFDEIGVPDEAQIDFADPEQLLAALERPGPTVLSRPPSTWAENARATLRELRRAAA
jgi:glycosyltransferase involved in cell wall biosynthesis